MSPEALRPGGKTISNATSDLDVLIGLSWPDALWSEIDWHSDEAATVWLLDLDYKYTVWRASLSQDQRWTLSPVGGPWENEA